MNPVFFRCGQQLRKFTIYRKSSITDEKGRVSYQTEPIPIGTLKGSLSRIDPKERERWSQRGHTVTHTIVVRGRTQVSAEDVLKRDSRSFFVRKAPDHAELGLFTVLYCEERFGVVT